MKTKKIFSGILLGLVAFSGKAAAQQVPFNIDQDMTFYSPIFLHGSNQEDVGMYATAPVAELNITWIESMDNKYFMDISYGTDITINSTYGGEAYLTSNNDYIGISVYGGKLTLNNIIYSAYNNSAIQVREGGELIYNGGEINLGNQENAIMASGKGSVVRLNGTTISSYYGYPQHLFLAEYGGKIYMDGNGSTIDQNTGTITAIGNNSLVDIKNTNIVMSNNQPKFYAYSEGTINLTNVNLQDMSSNFPVYLLSALSGTGTMNVESSNISGNITTSGYAASNVFIKDSTWALRNNSNITNLSLDNTTLDMTNYKLASNQYTTLTLNSLNSTGSTVIMNTFLGGDNSPTDKIVLKDATVSGTTVLDVRSTGEDKVANVNGIKLVDAQGTTATTAANFSLLGGQVDSSAYVYKLYQGDAGGGDANSFYLRNTHQMSDSFNAIANMAAIHLNIVVTGMNELKKRMGELRENSPYATHGAWVRNYARRLEVSDNVTSRMNLYGIEAGYDNQVYASCDNKAYVGVMAGYLYTDKIKTDQHNGYVGRGHSSTPSFGAYATWMNKKGWFADATARHFIGNMKATAHSAQGDSITFKPDRDFTAFSLEGGKKYEYALSDFNKITFEPKVEFSYAYSGSDSFRTNTGKNIHYGETVGTAAKIGTTVGYQKRLESGSIMEPFLHLAVVREFDGKTDITYDGAYYKSDLGGTTFEMGGGLNAKIDDHWNLYSELIYEKGSIIKALSGNVGVRYNW